jgi:subfamily B ATP-binding cassette protein MsbA
MTSILGSASTTVLGVVSALVMWLGGNSVLHHTWTVGDYFSYNMFLAFMIAPLFQMVNIGTQLTEAFAGLDRTGEIMAELEENQVPGRTLAMPPMRAVRFEDVEFAYDLTKPVLHGISFLANLTAGRPGRLIRIRQVHDHQPACAFTRLLPAGCWSTMWT